LSWLYRVFGASVLAVRAAQTLLGIVDVVLVLAVGRRLFGRRAALFAATLFSLHGTLVFYEGLLVLEPSLLALTLSAFAALVCWRRARAGRAVVSGALFGLATLARATVVLAAPFALWALGRRREAVLFAAAWVAVLAPVFVRNARQGGGLVLTTNAGVNFYAGNSPGANGRFRQPPGVQFFTAPLAHADPHGPLPSAVAARALTVEAVAGTPAAARSSEWFARSWEWMRAQPAAYVGLVLRKLGLVLQGREIAQIESVSFHRRRLTALRAFFVNLTWILPLAALGIWCTRRTRSSEQRLALWMIAATLLPCVVFFVTARYRLPALPFLTLFAGAGAAQLVDWARARRVRVLVAAVAFCLAAAALTRVGGRAPRRAPGWQNAQMAERVYALGDLEAAIRFQEEAARWLPDRTEVLLNLALYWSERNNATDLARAEQLLRRLAQSAPQQPLVLFNLGVVLEQRGRQDEARRVWERVLQLDAEFQPARERLQSLAR
jgi:4-amino-4-deoxy-L-arabinose transferase-like glycosyltransferase